MPERAPRHLAKGLTTISVVLALSIAHSQGGPLDSDLPAKGRSSFDLFTAANKDALTGSFENFREQLALASRSVVGLANIPYSRSLSRRSSSLAEPRVVAGTLGETTLDHLKQKLDYGGIFVGHATKDGSFEVISSNEKLGRSEFQIVSGFGSKNPKITYAPRQLCMSCHQNGGPIFPKNAWSETGANPALRDKISTRFKPHYKNAIDDVGAIDQEVRRMSGMSDAQAFWEFACGNNLSTIVCRRRIMDYYLKEISEESSLKYTPRSSNLDARLVEDFQANWPKDGVAIFRGTEILPDRKATEATAYELLDKEVNPVTVRLRGRLFPTLRKNSLFLSNDSGPGLWGVRQILEPVLNRNDIQNLSVIVGDIHRLGDSFVSGKMDVALTGNVFTKRSFYEAAFKAAGKSADSIAYPEDLERSLPPAVRITPAEREVVDSVFAPSTHDPLIPILKSKCLACHRGQEETPFNFMRGTDEEIMLRLESPKLRELLLSRLASTDDSIVMPPPASQLGKEFRKEPETRERLIDLLRTGKANCIAEELRKLIR